MAVPDSSWSRYVNRFCSYFNILTHLGGTNPAIRTLYYRLLRLLSASVQPLFVFDGPHKPAFKRNKRSGHNAGSLPNVLTKQLLKLFGFPFHIAPGEAEAECALLQREGIVDAVLSEDVDTLMFGCGLTLRNWSSEGSRGNHPPTHVSMYEAKATKEGKSGLDREGMILIAMMSGGDYITEGIPGCGIKLACQAARAGFGKRLCQISRSDAQGFEAWRTNLAHEIQTNETGHFRTKHKALNIPDTFPNKEVLGYYTHPVVSSASKISRLSQEIVWDGEIDIPMLRQFVAETFEWTHRAGAKKFIRGLAPALLVHKLLARGNRRDSGFNDLILTAMQEMELVRAICGSRSHFSTDGTPELRVIYHPNDIVGLDLDTEEDDSEDYGRDGLAPVNDSDEIEAYASDPPPTSLRSANTEKRSASLYDPTNPEKIWILETVAKLGIPLKVEDYEASLRDPKKFAAAKPAAKRAATKGATNQGTMDKFVQVSKVGAGSAGQIVSKASKSTTYVTSQRSSESQPTETRKGATSLLASTSSEFTSKSRPTRSSARTNPKTVSPKPKKAKSKTSKNSAVEKSDQNINPWTLSQSSPASRSGLHVTKPLALPQKAKSPTPREKVECIDLSSSPPPSPTGVRQRQSITPRKYAQTPEDNIFSLITPPKDDVFDSPSPKKKRAIGSPSKDSPLGLPPSRTSPLTPEAVSRKIDFRASTARSRSSSPDLPELPDICASGLLADTSRRLGEANSPSVSKDGPLGRPQPEITAISSSPPPPEEQEAMPRLQQTKDSSPKPLSAKAVRSKKYLMLRESLPGMWKEVDESAVPRAARSRAWRRSQVEVLDMTED